MGNGIHGLPRLFLSVDQQKDFFEYAAGTFYDKLFVVAVNTGLRQGEICAMVLNDAIKRVVNEINLQRDGIELLPAFSEHTF